MYRFFARVWAKRAYIWRCETQAETADISAKLALNRAKEKRALIEHLNKEADAIEANIKHESDKLEAGYYECENGHQTAKPHLNGTDSFSCPECMKYMKLVKLSEMTGQEKYELEKELKEAEKIVASKRAQAKDEVANAEGSESTAKYHHDEAVNHRLLADKIRAI